MVLARLNWPASSTTSRSRALPRDPRVVGEIPCGAADHAPAVVGDEGRIVLLGRSGSTAPLRAFFLPTRCGSAPACDHAVEQVLHHGMRLGHHPDAPTGAR